MEAENINLACFLEFHVFMIARDLLEPSSLTSLNFDVKV